MGHSELIYHVHVAPYISVISFAIANIANIANKYTRLCKSNQGRQ